MPKRLIDGEALWGSAKILRVPEEFRAEYAWLIPLAGANGVFEADTRRVWALGYSYSRPDVDQERCGRILDAFEKAKMLFRWRIGDGPVYGFFVGIDAPGRLPPSSHRHREKFIFGPDVPQDKLADFLAGDELPGARDRLRRQAAAVKQSATRRAQAVTQSVARQRGGKDAAKSLQRANQDPAKRRLLGIGLDSKSKTLGEHAVLSEAKPENRAANPDCEQCDGTRWVTVNGKAVRCQACEETAGKT